MPGKERLFFTGSTRIIADPRPSGLDLRVYACVSLHDGMSLLKKTGRGCYATFATLTAEIGCDAANLSRSLKRLVGWGYLAEERQDDRRRKTYRVTFDDKETWQNRQQSSGEKVGNGDSENGGNPPLREQHYSSLKGLDPSEEEKLDSSKEARFTARPASKTYFTDNAGGQLSRFERDWKANLDRYQVSTLEEWLAYCEEVQETFGCGDPEFGQAQRLASEIEIWLGELGQSQPSEAA